MIKSIAHVILEPRYSGAEIIVLDLIRSQLKRGIASGVIALRPSDSSFQNELELLNELGCELAVPQHVLSRTQRISWIRESAQRLEPDVIFAHSLLPSVYARIGLLGADVPVVSVLHTNDDFRDMRARFLEKAIWSRNSALVGVSERSIANYKLRVTRSANARFIPNGIDSATYRDAASRRDLVRKQLGCSDDRIVILQVGRISYQKQQCVTAEAVAAICRESPGISVTLMFAGAEEGHDYPEQLQRSVRENGIEAKVQTLGNRKDIPDLLAAADIYVMPSDHEAHSIAALEALASGVCCIFSGIEEFQPLATFSGVTLLPQCRADAMTQALRDVISSGVYRRRFSREMDNFSMEACAASYLTLAETICAR